MSAPSKVGSKGYCKNCGFAIVTAQVRTERMFHGDLWRIAWVHVDHYGQPGQKSCMWHAQPKSHKKNDRTLYQQIVDARLEVDRLTRLLQATS